MSFFVCWIWEFHCCSAWHYIEMSAQSQPSGKGSYVEVSQKDESTHGSNVKSNHIPMEDEEEGGQKEFVMSKGLTSSEAAALLEKWGRNELEEKNKPKVGVFYYYFF